MESIHELNTILSSLEKNDYFADFLNTKHLEAGIIRLREDQKDTQDAHPLDELYYVIEGEGYLRINLKNHRVGRGTSIFVPADTAHNFHGNKGDLIVLYVFAKT
jgi:mannose-6-phosphate isomerase-like protein (cupin superfamily)